MSVWGKLLESLKGVLFVGNGSLVVGAIYNDERLKNGTRIKRPARLSSKPNFGIFQLHTQWASKVL